MKPLMILFFFQVITTYIYAQSSKSLNYIKGVLLFEEFTNPDSTKVYSLYFAPSASKDLDSILSSSDKLTWQLVGFPGDEEGSISWFRQYMEKSHTFKKTEAFVQDTSYEGISYQGPIVFLSIPGIITYTSDNSSRMTERLKKVTYMNKRLQISIDRYIYWNSFDSK